jgi:hypothetical protein
MRTILIRADDFVNDTRRRERRRGGAILGVLAVSAIVMAGSSSPSVVVPPPVPPVAAMPVASPAHMKPVVSPASMQFPSLTVGSASPAQLFTIRNDGNEPLEIRGVAASDAAFLTTNGCGRVLEGRSSCILAAVFAPSKPGEQSGSIAVETSDGTYAIPLRGAARGMPPVELTSKSQPRPQPPCMQMTEMRAPEEQKAPAPMTFPTYMEHGSTLANKAAIQVAQTQLRNVWQVSLAGAGDPPLLKQLGEQLKKNRIAVVERADVAIHFDGKLDRGSLGRRRRAAEVTITRSGRPVLRYVLPSEEYRVGDNPAEAFIRIVRDAFNQ